jgi:preprotein translocase subunit SecE
MISNGQEDDIMARLSPGEFIRQVRVESSKIVWPEPRETFITAIMVVIMATMLGLFFFGVDKVFSKIVEWLISLA